MRTAAHQLIGRKHPQKRHAATAVAARFSRRLARRDLDHLLEQKKLLVANAAHRLHVGGAIGAGAFAKQLGGAAEITVLQ